VYVAKRDGVVARVEPKGIGRGVIALGGGRTRVEDTIDPSVGFVITARPGDVVRAGTPLATTFACDAVGLAIGRATLDEAIVVADAMDGPPLLLVSHRVTVSGVEALA
jgi:thymidine phosphorylase